MDRKNTDRVMDELLLGAVVDDPVLIGVNTLNKSTCLERGKLQRLLGSGVYGRVFEYCDDFKNCKYVLKIQNLATEVRPDGTQINWIKSYLNEVFFHEHVQANASVPIAPKMYKSWVCGDKDVQGQNSIGIGLMLLDKWDGSLHALRPQFEAMSLETQLAVMNGLEQAMRIWTNELRDLRIQHNDIHSGNILYKITDQRIAFVLNDWGLATVSDDPNNDRQFAHELQTIRSTWKLRSLRPRPVPIQPFLPPVEPMEFLPPVT